MERMGALAVALAKHSFFGAQLMRTSSVGRKGPGTRSLPEQGMKEIRKVIFSLCPRRGTIMISKNLKNVFGENAKRH